MLTFETGTLKKGAADPSTVIFGVRFANIMTGAHHTEEIKYHYLATAGEIATELESAASNIRERIAKGEGP